MKEFCLLQIFFSGTLESGIDVGQGITVGPGKFIKKNKRRALINVGHEQNVQIQNLMNVGPVIRMAVGPGKKIQNL